MQFEADASTLSTRAAIAAETSNPRTFGMQGIQISTAGPHIKLTCRNETGESVIQCPAEVTDSGSAIVPARLFTQVAKAAAVETGDSVVTADDTGLELSSGDNKWDMRTIALEELEIPAREEQQVAVTIPAAELKEAHRIVSPCVSTDQSRLALTSVEMSFGGSEGTQITATDSYRIASVTYPAPSQDEPIAVSMNPQLLASASKHAPDDSDLRMRVADLSTKISYPFGDGTSANCKLVHNATPFPDWSPLAKKAAGKKDSRRLRLEVDTAELRAAINRVALFATSAYPSMRLTYGDNHLLLTCHDPDIGDSESRIGCQASGELEDVSIKLNPHYLMDMAKVCPHETFYLAATDPPPNLECMWFTKFETETGGVAFMGVMVQRSNR